ncbi:MAG TPA: hypothetical protein VJT84_04575 [Gaiellaceae bacterium]|nr:hypothetical protein [Gaiellaceae bacterium]
MLGTPWEYRFLTEFTDGYLGEHFDVGWSWGFTRTDEEHIVRILLAPGIERIRDAPRECREAIMSRGGSVARELAHRERLPPVVTITASGLTEP